MSFTYKVFVRSNPKLSFVIQHRPGMVRTLNSKDAVRTPLDAEYVVTREQYVYMYSHFSEFHSLAEIDDYLGNRQIHEIFLTVTNRPTVTLFSDGEGRVISHHRHVTLAQQRELVRRKLPIEDVDKYIHGDNQAILNTVLNTRTPASYQALDPHLKRLVKQTVGRKSVSRRFHGLPNELMERKMSEYGGKRTRRR